MLDIGWSEILVIAVVAIIIVGPKDLPRMLRAFGRTLGTVRRTANDFKRQFDDALREAEREADLTDTRKSLESMTKVNPLADIKNDLDQTIRQATASGTTTRGTKPSSATAGAPAPSGAPTAPSVTSTARTEAGSDAA